MNEPGDSDFWAWLAGFWEGEGSLHFTTDSRTYLALSLSVAQKRRAPLDYILRQLGVGSVRFASGMRGRVPSEGVHVWRVSAREHVLAIIEGMLPHTRFRSLQLEEARDRLLAAARGPRAWSHTHWTDEQRHALREYWSTSTQTALCALVGRPWNGVWEQAKHLGLPMAAHTRSFKA